MSNGVENDVKGLLTGGGGWEGRHKKEWKEKSSTMGKNLVKTQSESSGKCGAGADDDEDPPFIHDLSFKMCQEFS